MARTLRSFYDHLQVLTVTINNIRNVPLTAMVTGSAGISVSERLGLQHIQEVIACSKAIEEFLPVTDVAIELGGEDAKITYFTGGVDQRMNGICAGGTGAFIDQNQRTSMKESDITRQKPSGRRTWDI